MHGICHLVSVGALLLSSVMAQEQSYRWQQDEQSLALQRGETTVWRLVWDRKVAKSYFHPLATVDGKVLTVFEPKDHRWHRGLWWSWKFINGVNYWEENKEGVSEGKTEVTDAKVVTAGDFSAKVTLQLSYYPPGQPVVMTETRELSMSAPDAEGAYRIDWRSRFVAGEGEVTLDVTPTPQRGGPWYGGYAGLSLRFPRELAQWKYRSSEGIESAADGHGKPARWVDLSGGQGGLAVFDHPSNLRHPQCWYMFDRKDLKYFSPSPLYAEPLKLAARQAIDLRYQVLVHSQAMTVEQLQAASESFSKP